MGDVPDRVERPAGYASMMMRASISRWPSMDLPSLAAFLSPKDEAPPLEPQPLERRHALIWDSLGPLPGHPRINEMI